MSRAVWVALALAATSCSLVFGPSQYTGERDGSQDDLDGSMDAARPDAADASGPRDAGDAGGEGDAGTDAGGDAGGAENAWPTCGDGTRQSSGASDRSGAPITITDAFHQALFGAGSAAAGEVGLRGDHELPRPSPGRFIDVAIASRPAGGAYVAGASDLGELRIHTVDLMSGVTFSGPLGVNFAASRTPDFIERIAMRTIGTETVLAIVGTRSAEPLVRGWRCIVSSTVECGAPFSETAPGQLATPAVSATSGGGSDVFFLGRFDAMQASDASIRSHGLTLGERVSGSDGQLVFTTAESGSPFAFWIASAGEVPHVIGPNTAGLGGVAFAGGPFLMARAINDAPGAGFDIGARVLECSSASCTCPDADGASCASPTGFSSLHVDDLDARFVEAERAGGAVVAVVGAGSGALSTTGTDVRVYAFDAMTGAALDPSSPGIVLGSGMSGAPPIGTLVADFGMRATVVPIGDGFDIVEAALVDLDEGGGAPTRRIFVSALRICEQW